MDLPNLDKLLSQWVDELPSATRRGIGTYFGAMVILDRLLQNYDLDDEALFTLGGARVAGLNPAKIQKIVSTIAPEIRFECTSIGGRTSPGPAIAAKAIIAKLRTLSITDQESRNSTLMHCLRFCLDCVLELQGQEKITFEFDSSKPLQHAFAVLLGRYMNDVKGRALIQHLVGAKLELRFEGESLEIDRSSVDSRDVNKAGDFDINDFTFHVTVSANLGHIDKCVSNIQRSGKRPVLLVPATKAVEARALAGTRQECDRIDVKAIEAFLSQNLEELALFDSPMLEKKLAELFSRYNDRIKAAEPGKPYLQIEWSGLQAHDE